MTAKWAWACPLTSGQQGLAQLAKLGQARGGIRSHHAPPEIAIRDSTAHYQFFSQPLRTFRLRPPRVEEDEEYAARLHEDGRPGEDDGK